MPLTIFAKRSILVFWQSSEYVSEKDALSGETKNVQSGQQKDLPYFALPY